MRFERTSGELSGMSRPLHSVGRVPITAWPSGSALPARVVGHVQACGLSNGSRGRSARFMVRLPDDPGSGPESPGRPAIEQVTAGDVMRRVTAVRHQIVGVTVTGGEPLTQPGFTSAVLHLSRELGLHTTLETRGCPSGPVSDRMLQGCDLVVLDLPSRDAEIYMRLTGRPVAGPLHFLERLQRLGRPVRVRVSVVAGLTDTTENLDDLGTFMAALPELDEVDITDAAAAPARAARMRAALRAHGLPVAS